MRHDIKHHIIGNPRYQHHKQLRYPHQYPRLPYQADQENINQVATSRKQNALKVSNNTKS